MVVNKHKEDLIGGTPGYRSNRVYRVIKRTLCVVHCFAWVIQRT